MQVFGGLDIGTNGVRIVVVNHCLEILYEREINYLTNSPVEGWAEQDPDLIYEAVFSLLQEIVDRFRTEEIYISFSSVMHSIMGVDKKGNRLTPLIIWADTRARGECSELKKIIDSGEFYMRTACPLHSVYWPARVLWLNKNIEIGISRYASIKEYIIFRLTGTWKTDHGLASTSGIYNPVIRDYDDTILKILKIERDSLSELVSANFSFDFKVAGKTLYGIIGSTDGPLANLGCGAVRNDSMVLTAGSSSAVRFITQDLIFDKECRVWNYILDQDYFILGEATNGAGILLNWLAGVFNYSNAEEMIEVNLSGLPYQINSLISIPTMMGERGPGYNEGLRGLFYGLSLNHSRNDIVISFYEGIAFYLKMVFDDVQRLVRKQRDYLILTGGLGISPIFRELLSYLFNNRLNFLADYEQSTAIGSAMLVIKEIRGFSYLEQLKFLPEPSLVIVDQDDRFKDRLLTKYDKFLEIYKEFSGLETI